MNKSVTKFFISLIVAVFLLPACHLIGKREAKNTSSEKRGIATGKSSFYYGGVSPPSKLLIGSSAYYVEDSKKVELYHVEDPEWIAFKDHGCWLESGADLTILSSVSEGFVLVEMQDEERDKLDKINDNVALTFKCSKGDQFHLKKDSIITKDVVVDDSIESVDGFYRNEFVYFVKNVELDRGLRVRLADNIITIFKIRIQLYTGGNNKCLLRKNDRLKIIGFSSDKKFVLVEKQEQTHWPRFAVETFLDNWGPSLHYGPDCEHNKDQFFLLMDVDNFDYKKRFF